MILQALFPFLLIASGQPVKLTPDTFDLTGQHSILITSELDGNGAVIKSDSLFDSDSLFVFILNGGSIKNLTIIGANGNTHTKQRGYMGGIRVRTTGSIQNCRFINLDKWAVDVRGIRWTLSDTTYITGCTFTGTKRDGYGYSVWSNYGTVRIDSCRFDDARHHIDGSSEGHRFIITRSTFDRAYASAIHSHRYTGGFSGAGMDVTGCSFYRNAVDFDLQPPFAPYQHMIENNQLWNLEMTGVWIKNVTMPVSVYRDGVVQEVIHASRDWKHFDCRYKAVFRVQGSGTVYFDDFTYYNRVESFEAALGVRIRYLTPGGKVDRFIGERVSGDRSLRIRVDDMGVEVY